MCITLKHIFKNMLFITKILENDPPDPSRPTLPPPFVLKEYVLLYMFDESLYVSH